MRIPNKLKTWPKHSLKSLFLPVFLGLLTIMLLLNQLGKDRQLSIDVETDSPSNFQIFYDIGRGINENDSHRFVARSSMSRISDSFSLPNGVTLLRVDPSENDSLSRIHRISLKFKGNFHATPLLTPDNFQPNQAIESMRFTADGKSLEIKPVSGANDPFFYIQSIPHGPSWSDWISKCFAVVLAVCVVVFLSLWVTPSFWPAIVDSTFSILKKCIEQILKWERYISSKKEPVFQYNHHAILICLILGFLILSRCYNIPLIGSYGDDSHKWLHAKMLLGAIPLSEWQWDHHTARLTIMAAAWLSQLTLGLAPIVYYVAPFISNVVLVLGLYFLGSRLINPTAGFLAAIWTILWSPFEYFQLMPSPFVASSIVLSILLIFRLVDHERNQHHGALLVILASLFSLVAYFSWIGSLFFLPPLAWLILKNRGYKLALLYCGILLAGYLLETLLYTIWAGIPGGRLAIIMANHMESVDYQLQWMDLFRRYQFLPGAYKTTILAFFITVPITFLLCFWLPKQIRQYFYIPLCFFFFLTFCIKSLDPLSLVLQHHQPRYAYPALPFVFLYFCVILIWLWTQLSRIPGLKILRNPLLLVSAMVIFTFYHSFRLVVHHDANRTLWARSQQLETASNFTQLAWKNGMPFVEMDNPYSKGVKFYLDILYPRTRNTPTPTEHWLVVGERYARVLLPDRIDGDPLDGSIENYYSGDLCLFLYQMPFRIAFGTLSGLGNDRFAYPVSAEIPKLNGSAIPWEIKSQQGTRGGTLLNANDLKVLKHTGWSILSNLESSILEKRHTEGLVEPWIRDLEKQEGELEFQVKVNKNASLLRIPFKTNFSSHRYSIQAHDLSSGELCFSVDELTNASASWAYLDIPEFAYEGSSDIKLVVIDRDPNTEGWIELGNPLWLEKM